ncbi:hypothetical protein [Yinghuangia seranimata]|uniref:hypothetical protein n=1 Tax=Yinghuangia seranimata TaxID=408067 RepID=UPI00248CA45B|nr:hypothetical protein [Yinghuangia seranimata]MDI2128955.1 hypothetical protein [Yinghuangia seranimata]
MRRRLRAPLVALLLVWAFVAGCSSGDDPTGLSAEPTDSILTKSRDAAKAATSVHVTGTWITQRVEYQIDIRVKTDGAVGTIKTSGTTIELLRVGPDLFVRGDEALYQPRDGRVDPDAGAAAQVLRDKFVKVPPDDPSFARLSGFTQLHPLLDDLFQLTGKVKKDGRKNVRGSETLVLVANSGRGGEVYVSLGQQPFPMRYSPGPNAGRLDLYEYNADFPVEVPTGDRVIDYGSLNGNPTQAPGTDAGADNPQPGTSGAPTGTAKPSASPTAKPTGKSTGTPR